MRARRRAGRAGGALLALALALTACASPPAPASATSAGARRTQDARVRSFAGRAPPDVFTDGTWVAPAGPTSLAALRGQVVYVQFAFPT